MQARTLLVTTDPIKGVTYDFSEPDLIMVSVNHRLEAQTLATAIFSDQRHHRVHADILVFQHSQALRLAREGGSDTRITALCLTRGSDWLFITDEATEIRINNTIVRPAR
jgi:hypothetical protein